MLVVDVAAAAAAAAAAAVVVVVVAVVGLAPLGCWLNSNPFPYPL